MNYLVFDTENAAQAAADAIYANMVVAVNSDDLINVETGKVVPKSVLTPDQVIEIDANDRYFPVFGVNAKTGEKHSNDGYTTSWAKPQETAQGKWVFAKPSDILMAGVTGYVVEPYDQNWFEVNK